MQTANCQSIKNAVLQHLTEGTSVEHAGNLCIVTLPIRTIDDRLVDVFVESRQSDFYLVHDAGKAANELILRGINITNAMNRNYSLLAEKFGVKWSDEMFQTGCKLSRIPQSALAVAMCSSMATLDLLGFIALPEEETGRKQFGVALRAWSRSKTAVKEYVPVKGTWKQHSFDFVYYPKTGEPVAINVISPGGNAIASADRAAFRAKDLEGTDFGKWRKVIVQTDAQAWTTPAKNLLLKCSDCVIEINSGQKPTSALIEESFKRLRAA
jgi:hypothetical protein